MCARAAHSAILRVQFFIGEVVRGRQNQRFVGEQRGIVIVALPAPQHGEAGQHVAAQARLVRADQFKRQVVAADRFLKAAAVALKIAETPEQIAFGAVALRAGDDAQPFLEGRVAPEGSRRIGDSDSRGCSAPARGHRCS